MVELDASTALVGRILQAYDPAVREFCQTEFLSPLSAHEFVNTRPREDIERFLSWAGRRIASGIGPWPEQHHRTAVRRFQDYHQGGGAIVPAKQAGREEVWTPEWFSYGLHFAKRPQLCGHKIIVVRPEGLFAVRRCESALDAAYWARKAINDWPTALIYYNGTLKHGVETQAMQRTLSLIW